MKFIIHGLVFIAACLLSRIDWHWLSNPQTNIWLRVYQFLLILSIIVPILTLFVVKACNYESSDLYAAPTIILGIVTILFTGIGIQYILAPDSLIKQFNNYAVKEFCDNCRKIYDMWIPKGASFSVIKEYVCTNCDVLDTQIGR